MASGRYEWHRRQSAAIRIPQREFSKGVCALVLMRPGPFQLANDRKRARRIANTQKWRSRRGNDDRLRGRTDDGREGEHPHAIWQHIVHGGLKRHLDDHPILVEHQKEQSPFLTVSTANADGEHENENEDDSSGKAANLDVARANE